MGSSARPILPDDEEVRRLLEAVGYAPPPLPRPDVAGSTFRRLQVRPDVTAQTVTQTPRPREQARAFTQRSIRDGLLQSIEDPYGEYVGEYEKQRAATRPGMQSALRDLGARASKYVTGPSHLLDVAGKPFGLESKIPTEGLKRFQAQRAREVAAERETQPLGERLMGAAGGAATDVAEFVGISQLPGLRQILGAESTINAPRAVGRFVDQGGRVVGGLESQARGGATVAGRLGRASAEEAGRFGTFETARAALTGEDPEQILEAQRRGMLTGAAGGGVIQGAHELEAGLGRMLLRQQILRDVAPGQGNIDPSAGEAGATQLEQKLLGDLQQGQLPPGRGEPVQPSPGEAPPPTPPAGAERGVIPARGEVGGPTARSGEPTGKGMGRPYAEYGVAPPEIPPTGSLEGPGRGRPAAAYNLPPGARPVAPTPKEIQANKDAAAAERLTYDVNEHKLAELARVKGISIERAAANLSQGGYNVSAETVTKARELGVAREKGPAGDRGTGSEIVKTEGTQAPASPAPARIEPTPSAKYQMERGTHDQPFETVRLKKPLADYSDKELDMLESHVRANQERYRVMRPRIESGEVVANPNAAEWDAQVLADERARRAGLGPSDMVREPQAGGPERIKSAALYSESTGRYYYAPLHWDGLEQADRAGDTGPFDDTQFLTTSGRHVGREEAAGIAERAGQRRGPVTGQEEQYNPEMLAAEELRTPAKPGAAPERIRVPVSGQGVKFTMNVVDEAGQPVKQFKTDESLAAWLKKHGYRPDPSRRGILARGDVSIQMREGAPSARLTKLREQLEMQGLGPIRPVTPDEAKRNLDAAEAARVDKVIQSVTDEINEPIDLTPKKNGDVAFYEPVPELAARFAETIKPWFGRMESAREIITELREKGWAQIMGRTLRKPADIAAVFEIVRHPQFETLLFVGLDAKGKIIHQNVWGSGALNYVGPADGAKAIASFLTEAQARGVHSILQVHNHPSGNPQHSAEDINFWYGFAASAWERGIYPKGSIVIDDDTFSIINAKEDIIVGQPFFKTKIPLEGKGANLVVMTGETATGISWIQRFIKYTSTRIPADKQWNRRVGPSALARPYLPGAGIPHQTLTPDDVSNIARLHTTKTQSAVVYLDTQLRLVGFETYSAKDLYEAIEKKWLGQQGKYYGAGGIFVVTGDESIGLAAAKRLHLQEEPAEVFDVLTVFPDGQSGYALTRSLSSEGKLTLRASHFRPGSRLDEPLIRYEPQWWPGSIRERLADIAKRRTMVQVARQLAERRPLGPRTSPDARLKRATRLGIRDAMEALGRFPDAHSWYRDDIAVVGQWFKKNFPQDAKDPSKFGIFTAVLATQSPLKPVYRNFVDAAEVWAHYTATGKLPLKRPSSGKHWGVPAIGRNLGKLQRLIKKFGEDGAHAYLLTPGKNGRYGAMDMGPKIGAFFLNMSGISHLPTIDQWASFQWNRWMGTPFFRRDVLAAAPRGPIERRLIRQTLERIAASLNASRIPDEQFDVMDVQALLWYYEKHVWAQAGARPSEMMSFADASRLYGQAQEKASYGLFEADGRPMGQSTPSSRARAAGRLARERSAAYGPGGAGGRGGPPQKPAGENRPADDAPDPVDPDSQSGLPASAVGGFVKLDVVTKGVGKLWRRFFTSAGDLPLEVFRGKLARDGWVNAQMHRVHYTWRKFKNVMKEVYPKGATPAQLTRINQALKGGSYYALDPKVQGIVQQMRDEIDALSLRLERSGLVEGPLRARILENLGMYLHRSYRAHDDPDAWAKAVPEEVRNRAKDLLRREHPTWTQDDIDAQIEAILFKKEDGPIAMMAQGGKLGSKDLSILKRRSDISPEIRALLGEYTDPMVNYAKSVAKMAHLVGNNKLLEQIRDEGLGHFLFERPTKIGDTVYRTRLAAEASETMAPLNGLYTTPEIAAAFQKTLNPAPLIWWLRAFLSVNAAAKLGKTVFSPVTQVRNILSNVGFAVLNGDLFHAHHSWPGIKSQLADLGATDSEQWRRNYLHLVELGVVRQGTAAGELRSIIEEATKVDVEGIQRLISGDVGPFEKLARVAIGSYRLGDEFWKVIAFYSNLARYKAALPGEAQGDLERRAAEVVRNTYPTYELVPEAVAIIRRTPLFGPFVAWPAEVARTAYKTLELTAQELKNPQLRGIAAERILGMLLVAGLPFVAALWSRQTHGYDLQEEEDLRRFLPPWQQNSQLFFLSPAENGNPRFIDLSYSDAHAYLRKPAIALLRGEDWESAIINSVMQAMEPFVNEELMTAKALDILRNRTATGGEVYNPEASGPMRMYQIVAHLWQGVEPGFLTQAKRIIAGVRGETTSYGKAYDAKLEALNVLTGQRIQEFDVAQALQFQARRRRGQLADARRMLTSVLGQRGTVTEFKLRTAVRQAEARREQLAQATYEDVQAAIRLGLTQQQAWAMLLQSDFSRQEARQIMGGAADVYKPAVEFYRSIEENVGTAEAVRRRKIVEEELGGGATGSTEPTPAPTPAPTRLERLRALREQASVPATRR